MNSSLITCKHKKILVTGPTGNVGREVVKGLLAKGASVVVGDRDPAAARSLFGESIKKAYLDFEKPETFRGIFRDINKVFLIRPPAIADVRRYLFPVIDEAKRGGVSQIVFLSLLGVEKNPIVPHYKVEKYIEASGIPYTFLRPGYFMQNHDTTHRQDIKENGEIIIPAGKGKTSFIDVRDIAEVAVISLLKDGHENRAYALTGSEALDYYETAAIFSKVLGRKISYNNPSVLRFFRTMRARGYAVAHVFVMVALYMIARMGKAATITNEVKQILGKDPITMRQYVEDYKSCWSD